MKDERWSKDTDMVLFASRMGGNVKPMHVVLPVPSVELVVKNLLNDRDYFEYRWEKPGLYKVVFVCVDHSAGEGRRIVSELNVNIVEPVK